MGLPTRSFPDRDPVGRITIEVGGPFALQQSVLFGFGPKPGLHRVGEPALRLAFCADGYEELAGVTLGQDPSGTAVGDLYGARDIEAVQGQVARMLSLDHDGPGWPSVGERDPVIGWPQTAYREGIALHRTIGGEGRRAAA
jgi:DNA-3-methyladenine glycosylase II